MARLRDTVYEVKEVQGKDLVNRLLGGDEWTVVVSAFTKIVNGKTHIVYVLGRTKPNVWERLGRRR